MHIQPTVDAEYNVTELHGVVLLVIACDWPLTMLQPAAAWNV